MNLTYSYKNEIFWIQNFLSNDQYKLLHSIVIKNRKLIDKKTKLMWQQDNNSNSMYIFNKDIIKQYEILLKHQQFVKFINYNLHSHIRKYSFMESLNWHEDHFRDEFNIDRKYAATYYINKNWNENWGGEFMFKDSCIKGFIPPLSNSLVIIKSGFLHKVNPVVVKNIPRFSIQTWIS
jgi:Rps23 Pro-64 3,4-dihydroxylase Tpa1-like proline 4-hydroxylase